MFRNSAEALAGLRHKQTNELLPTKNVARNTKLVYLSDELIALKYHNTHIAYYEPDGVRLDVSEDGQASPEGTGWFTTSTWDRIDSFTPARSFTSNGLRFISDGDWRQESRPARLYTHGVRITPDGRIADGVLLPPIEKRIIELKSNLPRKLKRYAARVARQVASDWDVELRPCCRDAFDSTNTRAESVVLHTLSHVERGEVVPGVETELNVSRAKAREKRGEEFIAFLTEDFKNDYDPNNYVRIAIEQVAPDFPYPQRPRRT